MSHGCGQPDQYWPAASWNDRASTKDDRPSDVGVKVKGKGGVSLSTCSRTGLAGVSSIQPPSAPAVVESGAREEPLTVAVLQEVAGCVELLCADGDRGGGPA
jgi:hypothetical protein